MSGTVIITAVYVIMHTYFPGKSAVSHKNAK